MILVTVNLVSSKLKNAIFFMSKNGVKPFFYVMKRKLGDWKKEFAVFLLRSKEHGKRIFANNLFRVKCYNFICVSLIEFYLDIFKLHFENLVMIEVLLA